MVKILSDKHSKLERNTKSLERCLANHMGILVPLEFNFVQRMILVNIIKSKAVATAILGFYFPAENDTVTTMWKMHIKKVKHTFYINYLKYNS